MIKNDVIDICKNDYHKILHPLHNMSNLPMPTQFTELTKAVLADCSYSLTHANKDFHFADYDDECYCKANLEYVIKLINSAKTDKESEKVAKEYASIIVRNKSGPCCHNNHFWSTSHIEMYNIKN